MDVTSSALDHKIYSNMEDYGDQLIGLGLMYNHTNNRITPAMHDLRNLHDINGHNNNNSSSDNMDKIDNNSGDTDRHCSSANGNALYAPKPSMHINTNGIHPDISSHIQDIGEIQGSTIVEPIESNGHGNVNVNVNADNHAHAIHNSHGRVANGNSVGNVHSNGNGNGNGLSTTRSSMAARGRRPQQLFIQQYDQIPQHQYQHKIPQAQNPHHHQQNQHLHQPQHQQEHEHQQHSIHSQYQHQLHHQSQQHIAYSDHSSSSPNTPNLFTPSFVTSLNEAEYYLDPYSMISTPIAPQYEASVRRNLVIEYMDLKFGIVCAPHGERIVEIHSPKVAQKSYGKEKRFLCPPPSVRLIGRSWFSDPHDATNAFSELAQQLSYPSPTRSEFGNPHQSSSIHDSPISSLNLRLYIDMQDKNETQKQMIAPAMTEVYSYDGQLLSPEDLLLSRNLAYSQDNSSVDNTPFPLWSRINFRNVHIQEKAKSNNQAYETSPQKASSHLSKSSNSEHIIPSSPLSPISPDSSGHRRKLVRLALTMSNIALLKSAEVAVISKPSQKRATPKNDEVCIYHGSTVSLFNRVKSQTCQTRYLGVAGSEIATSRRVLGNSTINHPNSHGDACFKARQHTWDTFFIWIANGNADSTKIPSPVSPVSSKHHDIAIPLLAKRFEDGDTPPICYNQNIILQCVTTGLISPIMTIRKVDSRCTVAGAEFLDSGSASFAKEDPVTSLQKVALQIVSDVHGDSNNNEFGSYLACFREVVGTTPADTPRRFNFTSPAESPITPTFHHSSRDEIISKKRKMYENNIPTSVAISGSEYGHSAPPLLSTRPRMYSDSNIPQTSIADYNRSHGPVSGRYRRRNSTNLLTNFNSQTATNASYAQESSSGKRMTWSEEIGEAAAWTIVGVDTQQYKFYVPPTSQTPMPTVAPYVTQANFLTIDKDAFELKGLNLTNRCSYFLGSYECRMVRSDIPEAIICDVSEECISAKSPSVLYIVTPELFVMDSGFKYPDDFNTANTSKTHSTAGKAL